MEAENHGGRVVFGGDRLRRQVPGGVAVPSVWMGDIAPPVHGVDSKDIQS